MEREHPVTDGRQRGQMTGCKRPDTSARAQDGIYLPRLPGPWLIGSEPLLGRQAKLFQFAIHFVDPSAKGGDDFGQPPHISGIGPQRQALHVDAK